MMSTFRWTSWVFLVALLLVGVLAGLHTELSGHPIRAAACEERLEIAVGLAEIESDLVDLCLETLRICVSERPSEPVCAETTGL